MKKLFSFILLFFALNLINLDAQTKEKEIPLNIGGYFGVNANLHNADFYQYLNSTIFFTPGVGSDEIPVANYGSETSFGLHGGLIINVPIDNMFVFS